MSSLFDSPRFSQSLFYPRQEVSPPPSGATDLLVAVPDGSLHVRWYRQPQQHRVNLLLFHGNGEVVADYDSLAGFFFACGTDLAVVDYRGYGRSHGTPSLRNTIEDAPLVLNAFKEAGAGSLIVMGRSLGSACAAELYSSPPELVAGFIWESGAADLRSLVRRRGLVPPAQFSESELSAFDPCRKLARGTRPLLVIHGAEDNLIHPAEAKLAFAAAATSDKTLCLIPEHGHNDLAGSSLYWKSIREFVHRVAPI